jgi:hypothetical protein
VQGDLTGASVTPSSCATTKGAPTGLPALNPNWKAACVADSNNNPAVLFTYSGSIESAYIYPQACYDPSVISTAAQGN